MERDAEAEGEDVVGGHDSQWEPFEYANDSERGVEHHDHAAENAFMAYVASPTTENEHAAEPTGRLGPPRPR